MPPLSSTPQRRWTAPYPASRTTVSVRGDRIGCTSVARSLQGRGKVPALLLDFDGTLADSLGVMRSVYDQFLLSHDKEPSDAEFESLNGPPLFEVVRRLKCTHGLA